MEKISSWSGVKFPPNAKLKHSLGIRHGIDFELYANIEIDRKDVNPIIESLKKSLFAELSRKDRMQITNTIRNWRDDTPVPKWWNPDSVKDFIAVGTTTGLLFSLDDPQKATVWVHHDTDRPHMLL